MCGIAGIYHYQTDQPVDESVLIAMRDAMAHRGPDGAGLWIAPDRRVGLGHRRLSIVDLSPDASQPMSNEDETLWIVYNGEIYNHAALRSELEQRGNHQWKTDHSDTEVVLHAYEEWGIECLARFRGMFAFALYDMRQRKLWLVRDRIGIKPLYYSLCNGRLSFASEIKALLCDAQQPRRVHEESLYHYLSFLTTPAPQTLFDGIQKLPGGCWLCMDETGQIHTQRYWDVWDHAAPLNGVSEREIAAQLLDQLRQAVVLRKVSDVPVGTFLSGGIDSSTTTALFAENEAQPVRTFSIGYDQEYASYPNELRYARQLADQVQADYHEQVLALDDLVSFLPQMVRCQDEPIGDPVCVPVYYVSALAKQHGVTVCQVGEGADELFCGYPGWRLLLRLQRWDDLPVPAAWKRAGLWGLRQMGRSESASYEWLRRGAHRQPIFWGGTVVMRETMKQHVLSPRMRRQYAGLTSWDALQPIHQRFMAKAPDPSHLNWMSYLDLNFRLPELLLMRVDKMSMAVSLEGRVPFLDHKFVEFALSIPGQMRFRHDTLKYILKQAVRGLIPDELIDRKKQGFGVPIEEWFFDRLGDSGIQTMETLCRNTDYFDFDVIKRLFAAQGCGWQKWTLLNFALWWQAYIA
jgi:asparagine synthase (glutamine-hydrolysing)